MKTYPRLLALAVLAATAVAAISQDSWTLKRVPKVGEVAKFKLKAEIDIGGQTANLEGSVQEKIVAVESNGDFTVESSQSGLKIKIGEQEMEIPEGSSTKTRFKPSGEVLLIEGERTDGSSYRMANLGSFRYPDGAVKVGDEWTVEIPADAKTGAVKATAKFKVESVEKVGDQDTVKVRMSVKESEGAEAATSDGLVWLDPKDGNMVKLEATWVNAPLPGAPAPVTAKVFLTRDA